MNLSKTKHFFTKMKDVLITDSRYLLPCIAKWIYSTKIKKEITPFHLHTSSKSKATLYQHGTWPSEKKAPAILILHGLYGHPFIMQHLAKMAQETNIGPVFTLHLSYHKIDCRPLLKQALDTMEELLKDNLSGIILAGHSMGAIESAYRAFVEKDPRILSVISIAGRLKVEEGAHTLCRASLKPSVHKIYEAIQAMPHLPLYQIAGRKDYNAPLEVTLVRKDHGHIIEDGMHFNILFHKDLRTKFPEFLNLSLSQCN